MSVTCNSDEVVNNLVDSKGPLKGKGRSLAQWQVEVQERLAQVHREMETLAQESRSIEGRRWGLLVYRTGDCMQLRWRFTDSRHGTWERVQPLLVELAPALAQWYCEAQDEAMVLNHREQALRYEQRTVERLVSGRGPRSPVRYRGETGRGVGGGRPPRDAQLEQESTKQ